MGSIGRTVLVVIAVLGSALTSWSQVRDRELLDRLESQLDALSRDRAQEYLDILESLQDVIEDYSDYMVENQADADAHRIEGVVRIQRKLRDKTYVDDPEVLLEDLNIAINDIKTIETAHRVKFNTNSPSCCRLGRSLRKELIIISELVEDYSEKQEDQLLNREESRKYLESAFQYLEAVKEAKKSAKMNDEVRAALEALKALGLEDYVIVYPDIVDLEPPDVPDVVKPPRPPKPPVVIFDPRTSKPSGKRGAEHEARGQISVTNSKLPILIENPSGDVIVSGTGGKTITARLRLEISASTHAKEEEYIKQTILEVSGDDENYAVRVDLPRMSDHRSELIGCVLEVSVPPQNPVECRASYGKISVLDVKGLVDIESSTSQVKVERATGGVSVSNSMGSIDILESSGAIEVSNSYAPLSITSCSGSMELENQYGPITLTASEGRVRIDNTGKIEITDHVGDITIDNLYGTVVAENIRGKVFARNGYQPMRIRNVSGSAELENQYAEISARQVGGSLSITNQYSPIYVEALDGPVDLSNSYSNISIDIGRSFRGGSTISNTEGTINVTILQQPNLVLSVYSEGGNISSSLPLAVKSRGESKSGELVLGEGGDRVEITATGGNVIIRKR